MILKIKEKFYEIFFGTSKRLEAIHVILKHKSLSLVNLDSQLQEKILSEASALLSKILNHYNRQKISSYNSYRMNGSNWMERLLRMVI